MADFTGLGQGFAAGTNAGVARSANIRNNRTNLLLQERQQQQQAYKDAFQTNLGTLQGNYEQIQGLAETALSQPGADRKSALRMMLLAVEAANENADRMAKAFPSFDPTPYKQRGRTILEAFAVSPTAEQNKKAEAKAEIAGQGAKREALTAAGVPGAVATETAFGLEHPPAPAAPPTAQLYTAQLSDGRRVQFDMATSRGRQLFNSLPEDAVVNKIGTGTGRTIRMLPGGGVEIVEGQIGPIPESKTFGTAQQRSDAGGAISAMRDAKLAVERIREEVKNSPSKFGAVGSIRNTLETAGGVVTDIVDAFGLGDVFDKVTDVIDTTTSDVGDKDTAEEFSTVAQLDPVRHALAVGLARSRNDKGRLLLEEYKNSLNDVDLTGFKTVAQVTGKLDEILGEIDRGLARETGKFEELSGAPGASAKDRTPRKDSKGKSDSGKSGPSLERLSLEDLIGLRKELSK